MLTSYDTINYEYKTDSVKSSKSVCKEVGFEIEQPIRHQNNVENLWPTISLEILQLSNQEWRIRLKSRFLTH